MLAKEFPELQIKLVVPDEKTKRHGQAVAAASLPPLAGALGFVEKRHAADAPALAGKA